MRQNTPLLTLWRVVLENRSPLSIGAGRGDGVRDVMLARDAQGLPMIPATSLTGVLRSLAATRLPPASVARLFGYASGKSGLLSRLVISHGHLHDARDRPVEGLVAPEGDPLLSAARADAPALRQRTRLTARGTPLDQALFDRTVLPAGHRFSVELQLWSEPAREADDAGDAGDDEAALLMAWLAAPQLRLGAQTRSGLGAMRLVRAHMARFDLRVAADLRRHAALGRGLGDVRGLTLQGEPAQAWPRPRAVLALTPEAGWRVGGGTHSLAQRQPDKLPDDLPQSELQVVWQDGQGSLQRVAALLPGASVKGALAHRTAFHARRLGAQWAQPGALGEEAEATVQRLFGHARNDRDTAGQIGQAGVLSFDDVRVPLTLVQAATQMHNSIDRYTGGVREHLLFGVENLHARDRGKPLLTIEVGLDLARARRVGVSTLDLQALHLALEDLAGGRLALGADSAGGQGWFSGSLCWCDLPGAMPRPDQGWETEVDQEEGAHV